MKMLNRIMDTTRLAVAYALASPARRAELPTLAEVVTTREQIERADKAQATFLRWLNWEPHHGLKMGTPAELRYRRTKAGLHSERNLHHKLAVAAAVQMTRRGFPMHAV